MNNEETGFQKTSINWLACIYDGHHLNPYKIRVFKSWNLASFNKKVRKIIKKHGKIYSFLRGIGVLVCNMPTHFI